MISKASIIELISKPQFANEVASLISNKWGVLPIHSYWHHIELKKSWFSNLPITLIAIVDDILIGTISIFLNDLENRIDLNPWIGCLYVKEEYRNNGVGRNLMSYAENYASNKLGITSIYLFTEDKESLYSSLNWHILETSKYIENGISKDITIMQKLLTIDNYPLVFNEKITSEFFKKSPVSMWACDEYCKIVLWNKGAEFTYGYTKEEVLGKNYLDLFVDPAEREESAKDCKRILEGYTQINCCAFDTNKFKNKQLYMLTNLFRIENPLKEGRYLQAEIGIEISDLGLKTREHYSLREIGIANLSASGMEAQVSHYKLIVEKLEFQFKLNIVNLESDLANLNNSSSDIPNSIKQELIDQKIKFENTIKKAQDYKKELQLINNMSELNILKGTLDDFIKIITEL